MAGKNRKTGEHTVEKTAIIANYGYDIGGLCRCVAVGERAVLQAIRRGRLKASKIGGKWIILGKNALRWIDGKS